jgi:multimeric flavodoxin WrbA
MTNLERAQQILRAQGFETTIINRKELHIYMDQCECDDLLEQNIPELATLVIQETDDEELYIAIDTKK